MSDILPQNSFQLGLNSVGYMVRDTVTQQNDTFVQFTHRLQEKLNAILWEVLEHRTQKPRLRTIQFSYTEKMPTMATYSCQTMCRMLWDSGFGSSLRNSPCKMFTHEHPHVSSSCTCHTFILNLLGICSRHSYIIKYLPFIFNVINILPIHILL